MAKAVIRQPVVITGSINKMHKKTFDLTPFIVETLVVIIGLCLVLAVGYLLWCAYLGICMGIDAIVGV